MAEMSGLHRYILRLITIASCLSYVATDHGNWEKQFSEMKTMMTLLDSKISAVDAKLSTFNVLEYAFKTNTIDNNLQSLNRRIDQMAVQVDALKESLQSQMSKQDQLTIKVDTIHESLKNLPSPMCPSQTNVQTSRGASVDDVIVQKVDDYGKKLLQSHKDVKDTTKVHHDAMTNFVDVVRSGFSKVMSKFESLLALEGQMSAIIPLVRQLSLTTDNINSEVTTVVVDIAEVKRAISDCTNTSKFFSDTVTDLKVSISGPLSQMGQLTTMSSLIKNEISNTVLDISEIKKGVANFANIEKTFTDIVAEVQGSIAFPSLQLGLALEDAKELQLEIARFSSIEEKLVSATSLSSRLLAKESMNSLPKEDKEMVQNLKKSLMEIENITVPLFLSVPYKFDNIKANIGDSFTTMANKTQCHSDNTVKLEIERLKETISGINSGREKKCKTDVFGYCSDSIQDLVIRETPNLKMPLQKLIAHLRVLTVLNEKSQSAGQNSDAPLATLLG